MPDVLHKLGGHQANSNLFISPETHLILALNHDLHGGPDTASPCKVSHCCGKLFNFPQQWKMRSHKWVCPTVGKKCINVPIPSDYYYFLLFRLVTFTLWNLTYVGSKGGDFKKSFSSTWGAGFMKSPSCRVFWHFPLFKYTILRY